MLKLRKASLQSGFPPSQSVQAKLVSTLYKSKQHV